MTREEEHKGKMNEKHIKAGSDEKKERTEEKKREKESEHVNMDKSYGKVGGKVRWKK